MSTHSPSCLRCGVEEEDGAGEIPTMQLELSRTRDASVVGLMTAVRGRYHYSFHVSESWYAIENPLPQYINLIYDK